ncbi:MAG: FAD-dependent oxidoreductase [Synergistetes bacterium]|nr:FAD-dependent oxidoreductase [Synergistota bacterium]MDW8192375.1 FAD-dependent oxidoreductase [Synergistota bacterium]
MPKRLVVIGGVAAGPSAAFKAKRTNPDLEVLLITDEEDLSYGACGLPYLICEKISHRRSLIARDVEAFKRSGIEVMLKTRVESIDVNNKLVSAGAKKIPYDFLVIATGASSIVPPFEGINLDGIFTLRTLRDGDKIIDFIRREAPKRAVIVGAGYIGVEMAESFFSLGIKVTLIELMPQILINMDFDMAEKVEKYLNSNGIDILTSTKVLGFEGTKRVERVITDKGKVETDMVLLAIGVKPNSELAKEAGLTLGPKGSIDVNNLMETSVPGVYAAGDCADALHLVTGKKVYIPLGSTANKQGRVAGSNAAGERAVFPGVVGTAIVKVLNMEVSRTGLSLSEAKSEGLKTKSSLIESHTTAGYYPGGSSIWVKIITEEGTGRILGGQIVGGPGSATRINVLAIAASAGMKIWDFAYADLAYAPPFAPVWDPLLIAAQSLLKEY